ncbi:hypothetical protein LMG28727_00844 [Paraburkholderia kirstenboschensis]|uniref:hypothetical protein n=1 Tax=Paraburkholderia kirstenboschensis TaxID=1245436 RepID=UPI000AC3EE44|nr:hypothetical protein [Paraburkholderia kirstenboschensis]CAD6514118.1 hypothetical protein LMG28727_00844 [Paraburkholderia kirstenboschensis]
MRARIKALRLEWIEFLDLKWGERPGSPQSMFVTARFRLTKVVKTNAGRRKGTQPMYHQFSESSPSHLRLMAQLGYDAQEQMGKSQAHASLLHSTLGNSGNTHAASHAPANPQRVIQRSAVSDIDREAERKYGERMTALQRQRAKRGDSRQEAEQLRRMSEARTNGGINDEDDEEIGADGVPVTRGKKRAKGSFERLKKSLAAKATDSVETLMKSLRTIYGPRTSMAKAAGIEHGESFEERYGIGGAHVSHAVGPRTARPAASTASLAKSIETVRERFDKILGVTPMQNLNKKVVATSEKLAKSLPIGPVRGLRMAAPQYSAEHVEGAAQMALAHGAIDAQSAQVIANSLALGGVGAVPSALMAKLRGE